MSEHMYIVQEQNHKIKTSAHLDRDHKPRNDQFGSKNPKIIKAFSARQQKPPKNHCIFRPEAETQKRSMNL